MALSQEHVTSHGHHLGQEGARLVAPSCPFSLVSLLLFFPLLLQCARGQTAGFGLESAVAKPALLIHQTAQSCHELIQSGLSNIVCLFFLHLKISKSCLSVWRPPTHKPCLEPCCLQPLAHDACAQQASFPAQGPAAMSWGDTEIMTLASEVEKGGEQGSGLLGLGQGDAF